MEHPSEETLNRFAAGAGSREENRAVVAHLVKGCPLCARKLRALMEPASVPRASYEPALEQFDQSFIDHLEGSIRPIQTLHLVLHGAPPDLPEDELPRKKR